MSKNQPQAPGKPNIMQNLLLMAMLFIGFQFFCNRPAPTSSVSAADTLKLIRENNAEVKDVSAAAHLHEYLGKLQNEKLTQEEKDAKEIEAAILVADTQLKAGILRNDIGRLNTAYNHLQSYHDRWLTKPIWDVAVKVEKPRKGPIGSVENYAEKDTWTAREIYGQAVSVLDKKNKETLVWGFFPGYQMIDLLVHATGAKPGFSYWFAAVLLALALRALLYPLSQKQMMYSRQMQQLNPLMKDLKDKYKDSPTELQQRQMALYKEYGLNPFAGCLPTLIQLPVIFLIYQCMLHYQFEFQKGTFLWINPTTHAALPTWTAPNLGQKDLILLVIYAISIVTTALMMPVADPSNAKQQRMIQVGTSAIVAVMLFVYPALPSAFVLYWTATNILTTIQVLLIYRKPMEPLVKVNTKEGGVYPTDTHANGSGNGKMKGPFGPTEIKAGPIKTGTPAKHKPKKRK
jgi:YidC/Oxa1 family membrane protein insertase